MFNKSPEKFAALFNEKYPGAYRQITTQDAREMTTCCLVGRYDFYPRDDLELVRGILQYEQKQDNRAELDKEIARLNRKMKGYISDERSLLSLFRHREIDRNALLDEINQLKADREKDEQRLVELTRSKQGIANLVNTEIKISEYCSNIARNLSNCSYEDKRLALDAFAIKLVATPEHFEISGILSVEVGSASAKTQSLTCMCVGASNKPMRIQYVITT